MRLGRPRIVVRRLSRSDQPQNVLGVLRGLLACRELMLKVHNQVKVNGACYYGA